MGAALWLLNAGLVVLMSTPILRVLVSFREYVVMRQWFFAGVTAVVFAGVDGHGARGAQSKVRGESES